METIPRFLQPTQNKHLVLWCNYLDTILFFGVRPRPPSRIPMTWRYIEYIKILLEFIINKLNLPKTFSGASVLYDFQDSRTLLAMKYKLQYVDN